jgi:diguanylate cyclase (GGDEF)-like protein
MTIESDAASSDSHEEPTSRRPVRLVLLLSAALLAAVVGLLSTTTLDASARDAPWWIAIVILIAYGLAERFAFHMEHRRETMSFTLSEVPAAFALLFLGPVAAIAVRLIGSLPVFILAMRPAGHKLAFNGALYAFETALTFAILQGVWRVSDPSDGHLLITIALALAVTGFVGSLVVSIAIACFEGHVAERLITEVKTNSVIGPVSAAVAAIALAPALIGLPYAPLATLPVAAVWFVLRQNGQLAERHRNLSAVHDFTRRIGESIQLVELVPRALAESMQLLRADTGSIDLHGVVCAEGWTSMRCVASPGQPAHLVGINSSASAVFGTAPLMLDPADGPAGNGTKRMIVPIGDGQGKIGTLMLTGRAGVTDEFGPDDMIRAEHIADQLAIGLRNSLMHARAESDALRDSLTGHLNRAGFDRHVADATAKTTVNRCTAVLMLDLDRFKEVNDTLGHQAGDQVLIEFSARLANELEPNDVLARFGGDEYAVLVNRDDDREVMQLAQRLVEVSRVPFVLGGFNVVVAASVGVAPIKLGDTANDVVRRSDIAMYAAKAQHTGCEMYSVDIDRRTPERLSLLGDLRIALDHDELEVHYQPKLDLATSTVIGVEALARWRHPVRGWVQPDDFIPVAEETGLIKAVTDRVLALAVRDARAWLDAGFDLTVSVNLSTLDLVDELLADRIEHRLREHNLEPSRLTLEITESSLMLDTPRTMLTVERLAKLGVMLSLDDFGTGYSSLSYLRRLPVTELKIDRSFISNLLLDPQDEAIVTSTILLGHNLGLQIVAEGVECAEISAQLLKLGCDIAQGFGVSRPLPEKTLLTWLNTTEHSIRRIASHHHASALRHQDDLVEQFGNRSRHQ